MIKETKIVSLRPNKQGKEETIKGQKLIRYGVTKQVESTRIHRQDVTTNKDFIKDGNCTFCPWFKQRRKKDPELPTNKISLSEKGWLREETYCALGNKANECFRSSKMEHDIGKRRKSK